MTGQHSSSGRLRTSLSGLGLTLVLSGALAGCGTVHPGYDAGSNGPRVATQPQYKSGTAKPYTVRGVTYYPRIPEAGHEEVGLASWYGSESPNSTTADGEPFDTDLITAAHKTFPLPSIAEVTNLDNGRTIRVRVNDRGPFVDNRIIDLSRGAAKALCVYASGTAHVRVTWLGPAEPGVAAPAYVSPAVPVADDNQRYIVQIGAFSEQDNAEATQDNIDDARIQKRGTLYIVYLGPYSGAAAAESHRQDAITAGFRDAILKRAD